MDWQFGLICLCITALAVIDLLSKRKEILSPRQELFNHLKKAGIEGTLGPPRLKTFYNEMYVIGCGRRILVGTRHEGYRLMARMKREMSKTLETLPAAERKNHLVLL